MAQYLVFLGVLVMVYGTFSYIKETVRGNTKPNRITWLMWSVAPLIGTAAALADGVRWAVLPVFMVGFGPLLIFGASYINPKSYWRLHPTDYICGLFAILALALWGLTKDPTVAIVFAIISDAFAAVPTLIKSWQHPETETADAFIATVFNAFTSFFAIEKWSFSEYAFPAYLIILNVLLVWAIYRAKFFVLPMAK